MNHETKQIMDKIHDNFFCQINGEKTEYANGQKALQQIEGNYQIASITAYNGKVLLIMEHDETIPNDLNAEWVEKYRQENNGKEPGFF